MRMVRTTPGLADEPRISRLTIYEWYFLAVVTAILLLTTAWVILISPSLFLLLLWLSSVEPNLLDSLFQRLIYGRKIIP